MITRTYTTEAECTRCWLKEDFSNIPANLITDQVDYYDRWEHRGIDEDGEYGLVDEPIWGTYFRPEDPLDIEWIESHEEEVAGLGFTLLFEEGVFFALGIDAAGYDFYEAFWIPLYRLRGFHWHE